MEYEGDAAYIWFYGDAQADFPWWIIGDSLPEAGLDNLGIYGYCAGNTETPDLCNGCWHFYFKNGYDSDCSMSLQGGGCMTTTAPSILDFPTS